MPGFPDGSNDKESACNTGDPGSIPGSGISLGGGNDNPLQYSCLENRQRSLVGYSPWGCKELDTTEWPTLSLSLIYEDLSLPLYFFVCLYFSIFLFLPFCGLLELFLEFHLVYLCYFCLYLFYSFLVVVPGTTLYIFNLSHITDTHVYWELILVSRCWHSPVCGQCGNIPTFYTTLPFPIFIITVYKISSTYILGHGAILLQPSNILQKIQEEENVFIHAPVVLLFPFFFLCFEQVIDQRQSNTS